MLDFQNEGKVLVKVWQNFCWADYSSQTFPHEIDPWKLASFDYIDSTFRLLIRASLRHCGKTMHKVRKCEAIGQR